MPNARFIRAVLAACTVLFTVCLKAEMPPNSITKPGDDGYWSWGWGTYGTGRGAVSAEDIARYDWSLICFAGGESATQESVDWWNEILRLDPDHKFVLRTWGYASNFMDYLYLPDVKKRVLAHIQEQVAFTLSHITKPENVVALTFQEELPDHFSVGMEKDVARYPAEIEHELGAPFQITNEAHRAWYGKKWIQVMDEINACLKTSGGGRPVYYYQGTTYNCLDDWDGWHALDPEMKGYSFSRDKSRYLPWHFADIVKPGLCDGIFGYSRVGWDLRTTRIVEVLGCGLFSQVSIPPEMRSSSLDDTITKARWENPSNKGTFFFIGSGRKSKGYWAVPYQKDSVQYWTVGDHLRRLGWEYKIGLDHVDRMLAPKVVIGYNAEGIKSGETFTLRALVQNRREDSWFGGDESLAELKAVSATLEVPAGFEIAEPLPSIKVGVMSGREWREVSWTIRRNPDPLEKLNTEGPFRVTVSGVMPTGTISGIASSQGQNCPLPIGHIQIVDRSGYSWIEPTTPEHVSGQGAMIEAMTTLTEPRLVRGDGAEVRYKGTLRANSKLWLGSNGEAKLILDRLANKQRHFDDRSRDGDYVVDSGYHFYTCSAEVIAGEAPRLRVTGRGDGGNLLVTLTYSGTVDGKPYKKEHSGVVIGMPSLAAETVERTLPVVPAFDGGFGKVTTFFYRANSRGTLHLQSMDIVADSEVSRSMDVSGNVVGRLPDPVEPFTRWSIEFDDDPVPFNNRMARVRIAFVESQDDPEKTVL